MNKHAGSPLYMEILMYATARTAIKTNTHIKTA
jgi:hypothetical protein